MLTKIVAGLLKASGIVQIFLPLLQGFGQNRVTDTIRDAADDFTKLTGIVAQVEVIASTVKDKSITGADKARMTAPMVAQVILASDTFHGKKPKDEAAFLLASERLGGAIKDVWNCFED